MYIDQDLIEKVEMLPEENKIEEIIECTILK